MWTGIPKLSASQQPHPPIYPQLIHPSTHIPIHSSTITLWALAEVALGGALHAMRVPLTGLFVGGSAVVLLVLMADQARAEGMSVRRVLLGATAVVLAVKWAASPHAPIGAFVAVAFQGGCAALVLPAFSQKTGAMTLAVVAMLESALQRVLIMTMLFGATIWQALDGLARKAVQQIGGGVEAGAPAPDFSASLWLIGIYVGVHLLAGIWIGWFAGGLSERLGEAGVQRDAEAVRRAAAVQQEPQANPRQRSRLWKRLPLAVVLLVAYGLIEWTSGAHGPAYDVLVALLRAGVVLLFLTAVAGPAMRTLLRRWSAHSGAARAAADVQADLPQMRRLAVAAWRQTAGMGHRRVARFVLILLGASQPRPARITLLTGPKQSGKTTSLQQDHAGAWGILQPVEAGVRWVRDAATGEGERLEAGDEADEQEVVFVGRFRFSRAAFAWAADRLREAAGAAQPGEWLLVDEIGPLELRGEGVAPALPAVWAASRRGVRVLLVVREGMAEEVAEAFGLRAVDVVRTSELVRTLGAQT